MTCIPAGNGLLCAEPAERATRSGVFATLWADVDAAALLRVSSDDVIDEADDRSLPAVGVSDPPDRPTAEALG